MAGMPEAPPAYTKHMLTTHGRSLARLERAALADALARVDPAAPTLCGTWDARHLAAHLVLRESTIGEGLSPLPKVGDKAVDLLARRRSYDDLVASLRSGPPRLSVFSLPGFDKRLNLLEYFVHHEDVRRAAAGWTARALPDWAEAKLWRGLSVTAKFTMRRSPVGVTLVDPATGERLVPVAGTPSVTLRGAPSELLLYAYGRDSVAVVEIEGDDAAVRAFTSQTFTV
jgi:uncharacterized protein (TIGR03085 family)